MGRHKEPPPPWVGRFKVGGHCLRFYCHAAGAMWVSSQQFWSKPPAIRKFPCRIDRTMALEMPLKRRQDMPVADAFTKTERLLELQLLFWRNPRQGLRTKEIADFLGVSERTARNYLDELSASGRLPIYRDGWVWRLTEGANFDLLPVHLTLEEGTALYLAARLLARHSDEPNPAIRSALLKLVAALPADIAPHLQRLVLALPSQGNDFAQVFRVLTYGWATRRVVHLTYHPLRARRPYDCAFHPYLLEPSAIGYAVYAIGYSDSPGALRTYKLERILRAELGEETFAVPPDFDGPALLERAWGVMYGEEEMVTVRLRFSPRVARRVKETVWHPSQRITDLPDGGVEWEAQIGESLEIIPWIRGWGADVEVVEPKELREQIRAEARRLARLYNWEVHRQMDSSEEEKHRFFDDFFEG